MNKLAYENQSLIDFRKENTEEKRDTYIKTAVNQVASTNTKHMLN